ncbi:MAG: DinB family protein [Thiohalomonadales bacterium]
MSEKSQLILLAKYNRLMNERIIEASESLSIDSFNENKGAFFSSVVGTLNHILNGDILWLERFSAHSSAYVSLKPISGLKIPKELNAILFGDLVSFKEERSMLDRVIIEWCNELKEDDLKDSLQYTNFKGEAHSKRFGDLILHVFLHQIHHRGQITTLLSQESIDFGDTDLPEIVPDENSASPAI